MKKTLIHIAAVWAIAFGLGLQLAFAQADDEDKKFQVGLRFAPNLALNSATDKKSNDGASASNSGAGVRYSAGITFDYLFTKNIALGTGAYYTVKRIGLEVKPDGATAVEKSIYNASYVQIPLQVRLFTNPIFEGFKVYANVGPSIDIKAREARQEGKGDATDKQIAPIDISLMAGAGADYRIADVINVFAGFHVNPGFINVWRNKEVREAVISRTTLVSFETGVKF